MEQFHDCVVFLVATNLNNIDNVKLDYIGTLSESGLEQLLQKLVRKYYQAFIDGDKSKMESTMDFINDVSLIVEDNHIVIDEYVNYCMLCNADFIIQTLFKNGLELKPFHDLNIVQYDGFENLANAFKRNKYAFINGADRINIKDLHQMCKDDPTINAEIMAIVDALHESFIDKEKYQNEINGGGAE